MPWGRIDDDAWRHPIFDPVGPLGYALFWAAVSYSNEKLLDGHLRPYHVEQVAGFRRVPLTAVAELVEAGCWIPEGDGYLIHDYHDYNPTRAKILKEREDSKRRQEAWRAAHTFSNVGPVAGESVGNAVTNVGLPPSETVTNTPLPGGSHGSPVVPGTHETQTVSHETAPNGALPPTRFAHFKGRLNAETNKTAVLGDALSELYAVRSPAYGRLGKLAKDAGGPGELLKLMFSGLPTWSEMDDPLDYLAGALRKRGANGTGRPVDKNSGGLTDSAASLYAEREKGRTRVPPAET